MKQYQIVIDTNVFYAAMRSQKGASYYRRNFMNTISRSLPESLHKRVKELADKDHISIDQFVISAIAEKIAAFMTQDYLEERAKRGSKEKFERAMAKIPDVEPEEYDKL